MHFSSDALFYSQDFILRSWKFLWWVDPGIRFLTWEFSSLPRKFHVCILPVSGVLKLPLLCHVNPSVTVLPQVVSEPLTSFQISDLGNRTQKHTYVLCFPGVPNIGVLSKFANFPIGDQAWQSMLVILALGRLRQEKQLFKASLITKHVKSQLRHHKTLSFFNAYWY